ncbi:Uncharacterised protein [Klebsiella pneumoniae]|nr:Uncharacterised protein [Klebsiella pneumoniae]
MELKLICRGHSGNFDAGQLLYQCGDIQHRPTQAIQFSHQQTRPSALTQLYGLAQSITLHWFQRTTDPLIGELINDLPTMLADSVSDVVSLSLKPQTRAPLTLSRYPTIRNNLHIHPSKRTVNELYHKFTERQTNDKNHKKNIIN